MKKAILYLRVSTVRQTAGESLERQEEICRTAAERGGYEVAKVFREAFSGREDFRPALEELFKFLSHHPGAIGAVFIRDIDRFTRGGSLSYLEFKNRLRGYGVELRDAAGMIQGEKNSLEDCAIAYPWSMISPTGTAEAMKAELAKSEVQGILFRAIGQQFRYARDGYWQRPAPFGFQNHKTQTPEGKKKNILIPHPEESGLIVKAFEMAAKGKKPAEICRVVNAMGYRSREGFRRRDGQIIKTGNKPLAPRELGLYLERVIYAGIIHEYWGTIKKQEIGPMRAKFSGLVSIDLWNRANRGRRVIFENGGEIKIISGKAAARVQRTGDYPFRRVVRCPECGGAFTGSASRGQSGKLYPAYHCEGKRGARHKSYRVARADFHAAVEELLAKLRFDPAFFEIFEKILMDVWHARKKSVLDETLGAQRTIADLQARQRSLVDSFAATTSAILREKIEKEIEELEAEIQSAKDVREQKDFTNEQINEYLAFARRVLGRPGTLLENPSQPGEIERMWQVIFSATPTFDEIKSGTAKPSMIFSLCDTFSRQKTFWQPGHKPNQTSRRVLHFPRQRGIRDKRNLRPSPRGTHLAAAIFLAGAALRRDPFSLTQPNFKPAVKFPRV